MPTGPTNPSAGGAFTPPTVEELNALIPQYEISAILGIGGMGAVYKGRQTGLARDVAIKVLPADAADSESDEAFNFVERFEREAQAMARLHHQRIIAVHNFGEAETSNGKLLLFIVMEFVEGTELRHLIAGEALNADQTLAVITQICDALHYAHEQGIVHRDIKPANIMLDVEGNVKVADFGLAKLTGSDAAGQHQLTMTNMAMGTPDYVSPEQLEQGKDVDHRADIYSLGVMIYEMLTGAVPRGAFLPPSKKATTPVDPRMDDVVNKAMQSDPDSRYQHVAELWRDVDHIRNTPYELPSEQRPSPQLITGRVSIKPGGGTTQKVTVNPATTLEAAAAKKKKALLISSIAGVLTLAALAWFLLAPKDTELATTPPPNKTEPPKAPSSQDKVGRGVPAEPSLSTQDPVATNPEPRTLNPEQAEGQTDLLALIDPERDAVNGTWTRNPDGSLEPSKALTEAQREGAAGASRPGPDVPATPSITTPIDLLAAINLSRDVVVGEWTIEDGALLHLPATKKNSILRLPVDIDPALPYHLRLALTPLNRAAKTESTNIILPVGNSSVRLLLGAWKGISGLDRINGKGGNDNETSVPGHLLKRDQTYRIDARVTPHGTDADIEIDIDGDALIRWTGPTKSLSTDKSITDLFPSPSIYLRDGPQVGSRFTEITLNPLEPSKALTEAQHEGAAGASRPGPGVPATPINLLTGLDPAANTITGKWTIEEGTLLRPEDDPGFTGIIELPASLPSDYTFRASFTSIAPAEATSFILPVGEQSVTFTLGGWVGKHPNSPISGLHNIDGNKPWDNQTGVFHHELEKGRAYTLEARVSVNGDQAIIIIHLDGNEITRWSGHLASLSIEVPSMEKIKPNKIYLYEYGNTTNRFTELTLIPGPPPTSDITQDEGAPDSSGSRPGPSVQPLSEAQQKLATLLDEYKQQFTTTLGDAHAEKITSLKANYGNALDREAKAVAATGNLEALLPWRAEIEALAESEGNALLSPLSENASEQLRSMRATYRKTVAGYEKQLGAAAAPLLLQFDSAIGSLVTEFTQAKKIEEALETRRARKRLEEKGIKIFSSDAPFTAGRWISLFNGTDLAGWSDPVDPAHLQIEDGILKFVNGSTFLYYTGEDGGNAFTDFEFKAQVRTENNANGGIYFHVNPETTSGAPSDGIEVEILSGQTGSLFALTGSPATIAPADEWFELDIRVEGKTVTTTIDGNPAARWTQPDDWKGATGFADRILNSGAIALQYNPSAGTLSFKDLQIRRLYPSGAASPSASIPAPGFTG